MKLYGAASIGETENALAVLNEKCKMICTTNAIESFNTALRKVTDRRTLDVVKKWTMPYPNWSIIRGKLDLLWGAGWDM